jgi:hypothetical protein
MTDLFVSRSYFPARHLAGSRHWKRLVSEEGRVMTDAPDWNLK